MAGLLLRCGEAKTRPAVENLLAAAGLAHLPAPTYTVQTPSRQRWELGAGAAGIQAPTRQITARASDAKVGTPAYEREMLDLVRKMKDLMR